ncbi:MAG: tetratricopeptide repeat protein [Candidatus Kaelpia aquatica]|nr:tetratricopeptide repeat protein [Candidatus Kaelpia aquatica]
MKNKKILLILIFVTLILSNPVYARRINTVLTYNEEASFDISKINQSLNELGYSQSELLTLQLIDLFPSLQYNLSKLSQVENPREKASHLAMFIKVLIGLAVDENQFELSDVLNKRKANCYGFAQLVYVLGKSVGLDVELLLVPNFGPGHMVNLIHTDRGDIILDLTNKNPEIGFYLSPLIDWDKNYESLNEEGYLWCLREDSKIDDTYNAVQIINKDGLKAELLASRSYEKGKVGLIEEELRLCEEAEDLNPNSCVVLNNLAAIYAKLGRLEESRAYFLKAVTINPYYARAFFNLGHIEDDLGYHEEAIDAYSKAINIRPDYVEAWHNRGLVKLQSGIEIAEEDGEKAYELLEQGLKDFDQAIRLDPTYAAAYDNRATTLSLLGRHKEAIIDFDISINLDPTANAYLKRGFFKYTN